MANRPVTLTWKNSSKSLGSLRQANGQQANAVSLRWGVVLKGTVRTSGEARDVQLRAAVRHQTCKTYGC